jgi:hypothetical protein
VLSCNLGAREAFHAHMSNLLIFMGFFDAFKAAGSPSGQELTGY